MELNQVNPTATGTKSQQATGPLPWLFIAVGAVLMVLGVVAIVAAFAATLATVLLFGGLLLVGGVVLLVDVLSSRDLGAAGPRAILGVLYILVGGLLLYDPVGGAIGLTLLIAAFFLVAGVSRLILAAQFPTTGRTWLIASGVLDLLLAALIWIGWPESGTWVIGLFVGIELFVGGLALLLFATAARRYLSLVREQEGQHLT